MSNKDLVLLRLSWIEGNISAREVLLKTVDKKRREGKGKGRKACLPGVLGNLPGWIGNVVQLAVPPKLESWYFLGPSLAELQTLFFFGCSSTIVPALFHPMSFPGSDPPVLRTFPFLDGSYRYCTSNSCTSLTCRCGMERVEAWRWRWRRRELEIDGGEEEKKKTPSKTRPPSTRYAGTWRPQADNRIKDAEQKQPELYYTAVRIPLHRAPSSTVP